MMTDLTAITTPFGLLDAETRDALKAHGGPYEMYDGAPMGWQGVTHPQWIDPSTYRVKPAPAKPREFWLHVEGGVSLPSGRARPSKDWVLCREVLP